MARQNKRPPAFQEYAANMLADSRFRMMSLAERGLLSTMRYECWVNNSLPSDICVLSRFLGHSPAEVSKVLPAVMPFFHCSDAQITCPDLEDYRSYLETIRAKQSQGGMYGAAITNAKRSGDSSGNSTPHSSGESQVGRRVLSVDQPSLASAEDIHTSNGGVPNVHGGRIAQKTGNSEQGGDDEF